MLLETVKEITHEFVNLPTSCQIALIGSLILCALLFRLVSWLDKKYPVQAICPPPPETDFPDKIIDPNKN
jgi:hypothetical protein